MLEGFDSEFDDLTDYILTITRRIWEERGIDLIHRYYAADGPVRAPGGLVVGADAVVAATLATLSEFPDRQVIGTDVIGWGGPATGWLSSHRILSTMTHLGDGPHGKATGRRLTVPVIADCWCKDNKIVEEWLIRDSAAFALGLGLEPKDLAMAQVARETAAGGPVVYWTPERDVASAFDPPVERDGPAGAYADGLAALWADKALRRIPELYDRGATVTVAGNRALIGWDAVDRFYVGYLAAFPDAAFALDSLIAEERPGRPLRVAARWSLSGTHTGWGAFGPPTGVPVHVMAISHAEIRDGRIVAEWTVTDEVAIWKQILDRSGAGAA
jgi:predicted ester cyclase